MSLTDAAEAVIGFACLVVMLVFALLVISLPFWALLILAAASGVL